MFSLRAAVRAARTATRRPLANTPRAAPSFLQSRFASSGPRYQRFSGQTQRPKGQQYQWNNFGPVYRVQYAWRNYRTPIMVVGAGGGGIYIYNLEEVPVTHRRRFNIISAETEKSFGAQAYNQTLQQYQGRILPADHPYTQMVSRVVERLLPATGGLAGDEWRVHVVDSPKEQNAFVMPGGKVFVFTGILPICRDEDGLASVLAHEIAHNVAHHAAERMSRGAFVVLTASLISLVFDIGGELGNTIANLFFSLPNTRTQELEADHIGLLMMAESCYDPQSAANLWSRMKEANPQEPPQFLSTHPSHYNRRDAIIKYLPEAREKFEDKGCNSVNAHRGAFTDAYKASQRSAHGSRQVPVIPSRQTSQDDDDDFF